MVYNSKGVPEKTAVGRFFVSLWKNMQCTPADQWYNKKE